MKRVAITMHDKSHAETHHFCVGANKAQRQTEFRDVFLPKNEQKLFSGQAIQAEKAITNAFPLKAKHGLKANDFLIVIVDGDLWDHEGNEYFSVSNLDYSSLKAKYPEVGILSLYYLNPDSMFMKGNGSELNKMQESEKRRAISDSILQNLLALIASQLTEIPTHEDTRGCLLDYCQDPAYLMETLRGGFPFCEQECLPTLKKRPRGQAILRIAEWLTDHPFRTPRDNTVFLSYAWADKKLVQELDKWLRDRNLLTRLDERDFIAGRLIREEILRVMQQCAVIVIVYSRHSKDRKYPKLERELAIDLRSEGKARVIYLCIDDTPLPDRLEKAHLAVMAKGKSREATYHELLAGILETSRRS